jgi:hypothetical protein
MSKCAAAVSSYFSTGPEFPTVGPYVLQWLVHFSALASCYLHYSNMCCSGYFIIENWSRITFILSTWAATVTSFYSTHPLLPTICQLVIQRVFHFSATITYYLHNVNRFFSGYFILQHWSRITYTLKTCAAAVTSFYMTGLVLPSICHHVLQRLLHFTALVL